jgi:hypothetical protein
MITWSIALLSVLHWMPVNKKDLPKAEAHPFYVSITELNIARDTLQVSLRVFTDDLERALSDIHKQKIFLNEPNRYEKNFIYIRDYLFERVQAGNGAGFKRLEWIGHEFEEDVCWIYGEMPLDEDLRVLFFKNTVLFETYDDQQNLVHLKREDGYDTELATRRSSEVRFTLGS